MKLPVNVPQCRVLTLTDEEHQEDTLYRLQKGWTLQFRLGPSLFGKRVSLYTNHPAKPEDGFLRNKYRQLPWKRKGATKGDDTSIYAEVDIVMAGSFRYYFTYDAVEWPIESLRVPDVNGICSSMDIDTECLAVNRPPKTRPEPAEWDMYGQYLTNKLKNDPSKPNGSGCFVVDPEIVVAEGEYLPIDCIQCQTVICKNLGTLDKWEDRLRVAKESGYNTIHFTPVQELGGSLSAYALADQFKLNPMFSSDKKTYNFTDLERLIDKINKDWKMMCITDIVLNHTANESPWIHEHPECAYNVRNCPHLRPAFLLDQAFWRFSLEIMDGKWEGSGIPVSITNDTQVNLIREGMIGHFLPQVNIPELFLVHVEKEIENFKHLARNSIPLVDSTHEERHLVILQDPQFRRLKSTIDMELALRIHNKPKMGGESEDARIERCAKEMKGTLEFLNACKQKEVQKHLEDGVDNVLKVLRYERLDPGGPKLGPFTKVYPITTRYFTFYGDDSLSFAEDEELMYGEKGAFMMAHNGWMSGNNPLRNFAEPGSNVYLRRELAAWDDSVKLRYGDNPEDCPYLWKLMEQYAQDTARMFQGIRLDNCHSTPLHVAEFMLDAARRIRPDLYVFAELHVFVEPLENVFVNRLGIHSLIREALHAKNSDEQARSVSHYGGEPVGAFFQPHDRPLFPSVTHAFFNDITHDNPSAVETRSAYDSLPTAALIGMASCASASNRGYDELVPHHIHVATEMRHYQCWSEKESGPGFVNNKTGIIAAKRAINNLHYYLGFNGFTQIFVDQVNEDVVAVTRHNPNTHESYILVAHTSFSHPDEERRHKYIKPLVVEGTMEEIVLEARTVHKYRKHLWDFPNDVGKFQKDNKVVNGLDNYTVEVREHIKPLEATMINVKECGRHTLEISLTDVTPGSVVAFKLRLPTNDCSKIERIRGFIKELGFQEIVTVTGKLSMPLASDLKAVVSNLSLTDINRVLYKCDGEERDEGKGRGAYVLDHIGALPYCGLQGFMTLMDHIRVKNDLGHPLCDNLRNGNWMMDYISCRLIDDSGTKELGEWFQKAFLQLKELPRYLVPSYFDGILFGVYNVILNRIWKLKGEFIREGCDFVKALALGSVQMGGQVRSSPLPDLSPNIAPPKPVTKVGQDGKGSEACTTLSAGLPHFACGYMRNWGRDTFISIRGLFLLTGRHEEARYMILGYAGTLRHGLIPNLLDKGTKSRFNCRDATWWWLQCIQDYCKEVENGYAILKDKVTRLYPTDDSPALPPGNVDQPLHDVIQEAMQRHFQGVKYRERNAGNRIDEQMLDPGFNNHIGVNLDTGFVYGGNIHNCGTWMDKMGSSPHAGNKGKPATPRDGSVVEIVGLSKSTVRWLSQIYKQGLYPYPGVKRTDDGHETSWSWQDWNNKLQKSFETYFWVNSTPVSEKEPNPQMINRRGIYKDSHGASQPWADFQLRPNVPIAMVVAPEMFNAENAWMALDNTEKLLVGPLGMRTLDPGDWNYHGNYDNSNDGGDGKVARGFNYHQGPEWIWPMGFYLRARLHFAEKVGGQSLLNKTIVRVKAILSRHYEEVKSSKWKGLPELTNMNGDVCRDSCTTQAWSMGCILEVLHDLHRLD